MHADLHLIRAIGGRGEPGEKFQPIQLTGIRSEIEGEDSAR
jgi:hypothetical protein